MDFHLIRLDWLITTFHIHRLRGLITSTSQQKAALAKSDDAQTIQNSSEQIQGATINQM